MRGVRAAPATPCSPAQPFLVRPPGPALTSLLTPEATKRTLWAPTAPCMPSWETLHSTHSAEAPPGAAVPTVFRRGDPFQQRGSGAEARCPRAGRRQVGEGCREQCPGAALQEKGSRNSRPRFPGMNSRHCAAAGRSSWPRVSGTACSGHCPLDPGSRIRGPCTDLQPVNAQFTTLLA